jgi:hypothetical protein
VRCRAKGLGILEVDLFTARIELRRPRRLWAGAEMVGVT